MNCFGVVGKMATILFLALVLSFSAVAKPKRFKPSPYIERGLVVLIDACVHDELKRSMGSFNASDSEWMGLHLQAVIQQYLVLHEVANVRFLQPFACAWLSEGDAQFFDAVELKRKSKLKVDLKSLKMRVLEDNEKFSEAQLAVLAKLIRASEAVSADGAQAMSADELRILKEIDADSNWLVVLGQGSHTAWKLHQVAMGAGAMAAGIVAGAAIGIVGSESGVIPLAFSTRGVLFLPESSSLQQLGDFATVDVSPLGDFIYRDPIWAKQLLCPVIEKRGKHCDAMRMDRRRNQTREKIGVAF